MTTAPTIGMVDRGTMRAKSVIPEMRGVSPRMTCEYSGRKKSYEMKVKECRHESVKAAKFVVLVKMRPGMMGTFANLDSQTIKAMRSTTPKMIMQMTFGEDHEPAPVAPSSSP